MTWSNLRTLFNGPRPGVPSYFIDACASLQTYEREVLSCSGPYIVLGDLNLLQRNIQLLVISQGCINQRSQMWVSEKIPPLNLAGINRILNVVVASRNVSILCSSN